MSALPRNTGRTEQHLLSVLLGASEFLRYNLLEPERPLHDCQYAFAKGAFGLVFLAEDMDQHEGTKHVVLKVETSALKGGVMASLEREYERLHHAIQKSAQISRVVSPRRSHLPAYVRFHRNIKSDAKDDNSLHINVLVLPYYPETVTSFLRRQGVLFKLSVDSAVFARLATECLEALAELHATGNVHQDVKFENMMVQWQKPVSKNNKPELSGPDHFHIMLIDFGTTAAAKQLVTDGHLKKRSRQGVGLNGIGSLRRGTDAFASPCSYQWGCVPSYIDDLIALGFCLWAACVTKLPWMGQQFTSAEIGRMKLLFLRGQLNNEHDCPQPIQAYLHYCFQHQQQQQQQQHQQQSATTIMLPDYKKLHSLILPVSHTMAVTQQHHSTPRKRRSLINPIAIETPVDFQSNVKTAIMTKRSIERTNARQRTASSSKKRRRVTAPAMRKLDFASSNELPPASTLTVAKLKNVLNSNGVTMENQRSLRRNDFVSLYEKLRETSASNAK